jgi:peptide deformylase
MKLIDDYKSDALYRQALYVTPGVLDMHRASTIPDMLDVMREIGAAGLTAPSIGLDLRLFVTRYPAFDVVVNPEYTNTPTLGYVSKPESSLLRPGWSTYVRRPHTIFARWTTLDGTEKKLEIEGIEARVFAHLCDSVNGTQIWAAP